MADLTKIQQTLQSSNIPGVQKLNAKASGDTVEIHGQAESIAAKQAAMRLVTEKHGDMGIVNKIQVAGGQGGPQPQPSGANLGPGTSASGAAGGGRTHKVQKGDTLSGLAQKYYGKAGDYNRIFEANRDQLKDADKINEGMTLKIP